MFKNIAIIGSSGAIGSALVLNYSIKYPGSKIFAISSKDSKPNTDNIYHIKIDYDLEESIENASKIASENNNLDLVIICTGMLHHNETVPEKSIKDINAKNFMTIYKANTIIPSLIAKYFIKKLSKNNKSIFAAISARVGSISDNHLGGWYAYRASKSALNMIIKNLSIEINRNNKNAIIIGLHPGTVDSNLSKPFQKSVKSHKIFTKDFASKKLMEVIDSLQFNDTGKCYSWDNQEILP